MAIAIVSALVSLAASALAADSAIDDETSDSVLERLRIEEREREDARAAAEASEAAERETHERALQDERKRKEVAEREAAAAFERRSKAMHDWHEWLIETLAPVLAAREHLYRRMPHRRFAAVRPACIDFGVAIEEASPVYRKAPDRRVDLLANDLFRIYRESARWCTEGAYFSFTVQESEVRRIVGELIDALAPYGLDFPVPSTAASGRSPSMENSDDGKPPQR